MMIENLALQWIVIGTGLTTIGHKTDAIVSDGEEDVTKATNLTIHALHDALNKLFCTVNFVMLVMRKGISQVRVGYSFWDSVSRNS